MRGKGRGIGVRTRTGIVFDEMISADAAPDKYVSIILQKREIQNLFI